MSRIDVSQWGEFRLSDMFNVCYGRFIPKKLSGTKTPFITTTSLNNGVAYYVDSDPMFDGDALTVASDGSVGETFYHDKPFSAGNIVVVMEPKDIVRDAWSSNSALFLSTVIRRYAEIKFGWENKFSVNRVRDAVVKLPITSDGNPDWEYMDNYIAELAARAHKDVSSLNQVKPKLHKINIDNWKKFKVGDLFERVSLSFHGNGIRKDYISEVQDDTHQLPLLGAKKGNNGIVYYGDSMVFDSIDKCIGIVQNGAASAGLVYPECDLFGVYTDAYAIKLKNGSELTNEAILFVSAVLQKLLFSKYSYYNKCTWSKVQSDIIQLPVDDDGQPNFDYMTKYIEMIQISAKCILQSYHKVDKLDK